MKKIYHGIMITFLILAFTLTICCCSAIRGLVPVGSRANVEVSKNFDYKKKRIAVLPFSFNTAHSKIDNFAADKFAAYSMSLGFQVVERQLLERIFSELKLEMSGMLSRNEMDHIGKLSGIDYLVIGTVESQWGGGTGQGYYPNGLVVRFIDVVSGEVVLIASCGHLDSYDVARMIAEVGTAISKKLNPNT